jgi:hypothetical protein
MLTQLEADTLFNLPKRAKTKDSYDFPESGGKLLIEFFSMDGRELFLFNITRGSFDIRKCTYQKRARQIYPLRRLDIFGSAHPNPDVAKVPIDFLQPFNGIEIPCPHLHLYVEGYMDKWAIPAPKELLHESGDLYETMFLFLKYCNVKESPNIRKGLFI